MPELDVIQREFLRNWVNQRVLNLSVSILDANSQSNSKQKIVELSQKASDEIFEKFMGLKEPLWEKQD